MSVRVPEMDLHQRVEKLWWASLKLIEIAEKIDDEERFSSKWRLVRLSDEWKSKRISDADYEKILQSEYRVQVLQLSRIMGEDSIILSDK